MLIYNYKRTHKFRCESKYKCWYKCWYKYTHSKSLMEHLKVQNSSSKTHILVLRPSLNQISLHHCFAKCGLLSELPWGRVPNSLDALLSWRTNAREYYGLYLGNIGSWRNSVSKICYQKLAETAECPTKDLQNTSTSESVSLDFPK